MAGTWGSLSRAAPERGRDTWLLGTVGHLPSVTMKGRIMRRLTIGLVTVGMIGGMLAESASAHDLTVRRDGHEGAADGRDIRTVVTGTLGNRVVLWIGTWDLYTRSGDFEVVYMDTHGRRAADRLVFFTDGGPARGFTCRVMGSDARGVIGRRNARLTERHEHRVQSSAQLVRHPQGSSPPGLGLLFKHERSGTEPQLVLGVCRAAPERVYLRGVDIARLLGVEPDCRDASRDRVAVPGVPGGLERSLTTRFRNRLGTSARVSHEGTPHR